MLQEGSVKTWPMSSIPQERIDPKRWVDSFSLGEAPSGSLTADEAEPSFP